LSEKNYLMLSIKNFHIVKYFILISLYQYLFFYNGTNYSFYLLLINILFLVAFTLLSIVLNQKSSKIILKLNRSDLLVLVFFIGYLSSAIKGVISIFTYFILVFYLILIWINIKIDSGLNYKFFHSYINSIVLIITFNIILFFVGISSSVLINKYPEMQVRLAQIIGVNLNRFNFFIFSNFAYTSMLYCLPLIFYFKRSNTLLNKTILCLTATSLILLDARGPFLAAIIILLLGRLFYNLSLFKQFILISGIIVIPFITNALLILLDLNNAEAISLLSRRDAIWNIAISNYSPNLYELIFGYGYIGQFSSGISELYSHLFPGYGNQEQISVHNSYLQILLDYGLLGWLLLVVTCLKLLKKFKEKNQMVLHMILVFLIVCGVTDLSIQPNNINALITFLIIANTKVV